MKATLEMALEALTNLSTIAVQHAIELIKTELAKPEQEPVGWFLKDHLETYMESYKDIKGAIPLYTSPPSKEWVGLSVNEGRDFFESKLTRAELITEINEFLEEKNT